MKLLAISDLHGKRAALERILRAATNPQVILLGGDITHFGTGNEAAHIVQRCRETGATVLAVAGNCDSPEIDRTLERLGVGLLGRGVAVEGTGFYGLSGMPRWHGSMYELTEVEIATALAAGRTMLEANADVERYVLLSHPPPRDAADATHYGDRVGSVALREHIERHPVDLVICGHIHEAYGTTHIGKTPIVNCGAGNEGHYAEIELGRELRIELRCA